MFCPKCGQQQVSDNTRFCSQCGLSINGLAEWIASGGNLTGASRKCTYGINITQT
jgi:uncharacterized membrane protein YvbJ